MEAWTIKNTNIKHIIPWTERVANEEVLRKRGKHLKGQHVKI